MCTEADSCKTVVVDISATDDALTRLQKKHFKPLHTIHERATVQPSTELFFSSCWVRPSTKTMHLSTARAENRALDQPQAPLHK